MESKLLRTPMLFSNCLVMLAFFSGNACAEAAKPLHTFQGYYELVGRSDGNTPELVDDIIELRVAPVIGLKLDTCHTGEGWMKYETVKNNQPVLIGRLGRERLFCSTFNDRPDGQIFGCVISVKGSDEKPGRLFLWPVSELSSELNGPVAV